MLAAAVTSGANGRKPSEWCAPKLTPRYTIFEASSSSTPSGAPFGSQSRAAIPASARSSDWRSAWVWQLEQRDVPVVDQMEQDAEGLQRWSRRP